MMEALMVRDLIRDMMASQVDHGSAMDTGGGFGSADLWLVIGGREYVVTVTSGKLKTPAKATEEPTP